MSMGLLFWILWVICALFGALSWSGSPIAGRFGPWGGVIVLLAMLGLLGWHTFGPILR